MPLNPTTNDITGDKIQSHTLTEQGRKNWDNIDWGARAREADAVANESNSITLEDIKKAQAILNSADVGCGNVQV